MEDCDISSMLQKDQFSSEHHLVPQQIDTNIELKSSVEYLDHESPIQIEDDPYHSYQVDKKLPFMDI